MVETTLSSSISYVCVNFHLGISGDEKAFSSLFINLLISILACGDRTEFLSDGNTMRRSGTRTTFNYSTECSSGRPINTYLENWPWLSTKPSNRIGNFTSQLPTIFWILKSKNFAWNMKENVHPGIFLFLKDFLCFKYQGAFDIYFKLYYNIQNWKSGKMIPILC